MARAIMAEFATEEALAAAARLVHERRLGAIEAYGPYPLQGIASLQHTPTWIVPLITTVAALAGAAGTYWLQYWMNAVDYPLNVGGRPLHSWPAFIPASIIIGVLAGGAATLVGMLMLCGLPRLDHEMLDIPGFERASQDRFFLRIDLAEADRMPQARALFEANRPIAIHEMVR